MPFRKFKASSRGGDNTLGPQAVRVQSHVDSDARTTLRFHQNPRELLAWFERFHDNTAPVRKRPPPPRKSSSAFLDDDEAATASLRLNIAIHVVGSRGDVQPFIPIAQALSKPPFRHRVRICTHPVFKDFVESKGVEFFSIGGDPEALMAYMVKNPGLLPKRESFKAGDVGQRRLEMAGIMAGCWRSCIEAGNGLGTKLTAAKVPESSDLFLADAIIANPPSMAHIHCAEKLGIPLHMVFTMPWSPTRQYHHPLAAMQYGETDPSVANYLSFIMMELLTWQGLSDVINRFRTRTLKLDPVSPLWGHQLLSRLQVPFTYLWSESLIPKPQDWGPYIRIAGFSFLPQHSSYTPPPDLVEFLDKGPPPIYIGFGSIVVDNPSALTKLLFDAVRLSKVRAIISKGWGGLGEGEVPSDVYLVGDCPHDWLFQRVSCVVHHGGAGTTAAGLAAGRPTVVVPFFGDQAFWGQVIARAGAGPSPIPFKDMTAEKLADGISFALRPGAQTAAQEIARSIAQENGASSAAMDIQDRLQVDDLRCDICPDRLAVWKDKKTGAHLSSFAAFCLIEQHSMKLQHLKLLRRKHWYVDEGAEDIIIGITAAFSSFFTNVAVATSNYVRCLKSPASSKCRRPSVKQDAKMPPGASVGSQSVSTEEGSGEIPEPRGPTPEKLQKVAMKLAKKSLKSVEGVPISETLRYHTEKPESSSKPLFVISPPGRLAASGRYAGELACAGLKFPVAFFYNVANGLHNFPSYVLGMTDVRRRREITGFGSGCRVAGEEFVLGFYEGFAGLAVRPYKGSKSRGLSGFGKGLLEGTYGFFGSTSSGIVGLLGYTLKGCEKELSKQQLTDLKAELLLIRIRQGCDDYWNATEAQKSDIRHRWEMLYPRK